MGLGFQGEQLFNTGGIALSTVGQVQLPNLIMTADLCCSHRAKAQALIQNLSLLLVDASVGTIQCLEEIVRLPAFIFFIHSTSIFGVFCFLF